MTLYLAILNVVITTTTRDNSWNIADFSFLFLSCFSAAACPFWG
jgi:hypothetical protein